MRLIEKWHKESEEQEKKFLKQNLYSCFASVDTVNKEYHNFQEAFELLRRGKCLNFKGFPYFQVLPLVFINHHRFYNAEIIELLKENVAECSSNQQVLEYCFCLFTILFFIYSGCSMESALDMLNEICKNCFEQKLFDNDQFYKKLTISDLDTIKSTDNLFCYILTAVVYSIRTSVDRESIANNFQKSTDTILILTEAINGLLRIPENIDYEIIDNKSEFIKKFYRFCINDNTFSLLDLTNVSFKGKY